MTQFKNAMEIYNLLDRSNCRECGFKTCMAFAGAVFLGQRVLADCTRLDAEILARFGDTAQSGAENGDTFLEMLQQWAQQVAAIDLADAARRTGGQIVNGRLILQVLGKEVTIEPDGRIRTDIHVNPWVAGPLYSYILNTPGLEPIGSWRSFRELRGGRDRYPLFHRRGEQGLKQVADRYPDLFQDMVDLFGAREVERQFQSDISVVLHPLPKIPLLVCYAFAEEGIGSTLNLFFDSTADQNLDIGSLYNLGGGLAQMFEKLALRHGVVIAAP